MKIFVADIGGTNIKYGIVNHTNQIDSFSEEPTNSHEGGQRIIERMINIIYQFKDLDAIAISTAGQVDAEKGNIIYANDNIPYYTGMEIKRTLEQEFNLPTYVENDVNAAALGELKYGAAKDSQSFICLTYGTGIGGSIIINEKVYRGFDGLAGEFGHMIIHPDGRKCNCGKYGCYEQYGSTTALMREAQKIDDRITNGKELFEKINDGQAELEEVLNNWMLEIAYGLTSIIHIFNPKLIVLGGGIMENEDVVIRIKKYVDQLVMDSFKGVQLKSAQLGNQAGLFGAASLVM